MSPPPPIDGDSTQSLVKDGLVASILGGLAATARLLLSTEPVSIGWVIRRVSAAAITASIVGYGLQDHIASPGLRMAVVGACGYSAPELLDFLSKWLKARGQAELAKVTKKPNGKTKPSKRGK